MTEADPVRRDRLGRFSRACLYVLAAIVAILAIAAQYRAVILETALPDLLRSYRLPADGLAVESVDLGGATLTDIALANGRVRIGRLRIDWSPVDWLEGRTGMVVRHVGAEDVEAEVIIDPDGRFQLAGLESLVEGGDEVQDTPGRLPFETASLDRVTLRLSTGAGDAVLRASLAVRQGEDGALNVSGRLSPEGFGGAAELPLRVTLTSDGRVRGEVEIVDGTWRSAPWRVDALHGWVAFEGSWSDGIDGDIFVEADQVSRADAEIGRLSASLSVRHSRPTRLLVWTEAGFGRAAAELVVADWSPVEPRGALDLAFDALDLAAAGEALALDLPRIAGRWGGRVKADLPLAPLVRGDPVARIVAETGITSSVSLVGRAVEFAGIPVEALTMEGVAARNGEGTISVAGKAEAAAEGRLFRAPFRLNFGPDVERGPSGTLRGSLDAGIEVLDGERPARYVAVEAHGVSSADGWRADAVVRPAAQSLDMPGIGSLFVEAGSGVTVTAEAAAGEAPRLNLTFADATLSLGDASVEGAAGFADIDLASSTGAGRLTWRQVFVPGGALAPVAGSVAATLLDGRLEGEGEILGPLDVSAEVTFIHDLSSGDGSAEFVLPGFRLDQGGARAAAVFPALDQAGLRAIAGSIAAQAALAWGKEPAQAAEVRLSEVAVTSDYGSAAGLSGVLRLDRLWPPRTAVPATIDIPVLDFGAIMTDGRVRIGIDGDRLRISEARFDWAGGEVSFEPITTTLGARERSVVLRVQDLDLKEVLAAAPVEGLSLTGRVSGAVPMRLSRDTIAFEDATIASQGPGTLRYVFGSGAGLAETDASIGLLVSALEDFRYEGLIVTLNGALGSDLTAGVRINGANPALYEGYPIALNVNITGALDSILRRSLETAEIGRRAQEFYQRQVRGR